MKNMPAVLKWIIVLFLLTNLSTRVYALTPEQVFNKVEDSIFVAKTLDVQGNVKSFRSGVLLPTGKVAANCHVVEGGDSILVIRGSILHSGLVGE